MFYSLHVVEPLRHDSVLIKETNEWMNELSFQYWKAISLIAEFIGT